MVASADGSIGTVDQRNSTQSFAAGTGSALISSSVIVG